MSRRIDTGAPKELALAASHATCAESPNIPYNAKSRSKCYGHFRKSFSIFDLEGAERRTPIVLPRQRGFSAAWLAADDLRHVAVRHCRIARYADAGKVLCEGGGGDCADYYVETECLATGSTLKELGLPNNVVVSIARDLEIIMPMEVF